MEHFNYHPPPHKKGYTSPQRIKLNVPCNSLLELEMQTQDTVRLFLLTSRRDGVVIEPANTCLQALVDAPRVTAVRHCAHLGTVLTPTEDPSSDNVYKS